MLLPRAAAGAGAGAGVSAGACELLAWRSVRLQRHWSRFASSSRLLSPLTKRSPCRQPAIVSTVSASSPRTELRISRLPWLCQHRGHSSKNDGNTGKDGGLEKQAINSTKPISKAKSLLSKTLHEDIYTLPNLLTLSRLGAAPFVGYFILHDNHSWALGLLAYSAVTDLLDGWIARRWNKKTVVGTVIDPMADKALMAILTVALAAKGALPVWLATIILGRDAGLGIAAVYYRWISLPPPKTFARYWDFSLPSAEVHPTTISKYNTFLQLALIGLTTAAPVMSADLETPLRILQYVVATTTIWSGLSYVYTKDAVKILNKPRSGK